MEGRSGNNTIELYIKILIELNLFLMRTIDREGRRERGGERENQADL